ncbi:MAG: DUF4876 domain-containing protein [Niabella sp.]
MMKKQVLLIATILIVLTFGCRKSDVDTVQPVALSVQVSYSAADSALGLSKSGVTVTITNLTSGQVNTANTDETGIATFASITPGNYSIAAAKNYTAEEFYAETAVTVTSNVAYNATESQTFNTNTMLSLTLVSGKIGDLVFKQIYYAGSNTSTGASFRDVFVEIYNNSNETIYLDSLYIGNTLSENSKVSAGAVSFDWTQSVGISNPNGGDLNDDYLYFRYLFMIPGSGKDHPLEPGKSIIIAQTALNHTASYTDNNGTVVSVTNPDLTVDLSAADFEAYLVEYKQAASAYRYDVNNPQVENLDVIYVNSGSDWVFDATGREDFVMFKSSAASSSWTTYPDPSVATVTSSTSYGLQVPSEGVIDAVEIITPLETNRIPKRLPVKFDAAGTYVTGGQYSSQSLIRKTVKTVDGRIILQDTNNSSNDFLTKSKADPSKTDASFEQ